MRRALWWGVLVVLLLVAQTLLVTLAIKYEAARQQEEAEAAAAQVATELRRELLRQVHLLQTLGFTERPDEPWEQAALAILRQRQGPERVEWRGPDLAVLAAVDTPFSPTLFSHLPRRALTQEAGLACSDARHQAAPRFSRSYFVPLAEGQGIEVTDLCVPLTQGGKVAGFLVGSYALSRALESALSSREARRHEFSIVEADGTRLARAGLSRGANVYVARHVVDLPGASLQLRADSAAGRPSLLPNVTTAMVIGLSLALFAVVLVLARDGRRRAEAERALGEALAFRNAMEDSLPTGLRARNLQGVVTYANPAFRAMVGFDLNELLAPATQGGTPPYWPPEFVPEYLRRQQLRLGSMSRHLVEIKGGHETVFMRKNGERFPVMIYEAPLVDGEGQHTGWMSAVVDLSAQRQVEEVSRQQQERLQASARLATVGEMASLLSHELNQPLAAIASYATGSLNLLEAADADADANTDTPALVEQALTRIAEQADRAGRVIKSVHAFVRRREQQHENVDAQALFEAILPLARMQARKSGTRIELDLPTQALRVRCDRTMVEQVLLNLSRNGIQAMEDATPQAERVLTLTARQSHPRWVTFSVRDAGPGIPPEVAAKLFTPFYTTRSEGMGLGLSLCRTVIEQHGGALDFGAAPAPEGGTEFRFTLPSPPNRTLAKPVPESGENPVLSDPR